ncbi:MAG: ParA family protein [Rhodospirillaceae bacterium]
MTDFPLVISIANRKGGTGKTTTAVNLAAEMAALSIRTLLIDIDTQNHASLGLGLAQADFNAPTAHSVLRSGDATIESAIRETPWRNLAFVPPDPLFDDRDALDDFGMLDRALRQVGIARRFDLIIVDTPSSLGIALMNGLACADGLLVPIVPHSLALDGSLQLMRFIFRMALLKASGLAHTAILPMMFDDRTALHTEILDQARATHGADKILRGIRTDLHLIEAFGAGKPSRNHAPRSRGTGDYHALAKYLRDNWLPPNIQDRTIATTDDSKYTERLKQICRKNINDANR